MMELINIINGKDLIVTCNTEGLAVSAFRMQNVSVQENSICDENEQELAFDDKLVEISRNEDGSLTAILPHMTVDINVIN